MLKKNLDLKVEHKLTEQVKDKKKKPFIFNFPGEFYKDFLTKILPWLLK